MSVELSRTEALPKKSVAPKVGFLPQKSFQNLVSNQPIRIYEPLVLVCFGTFISRLVRCLVFGD
jgi:hypothetical protein